MKAVVQPVEGVEVGPELEQELLAYAREHVAHFKCPKSEDFEDELPRLPTGKLYKRLLKDRYWERGVRALCNESGVRPHFFPKTQRNGV